MRHQDLLPLIAPINERSTVTEVANELRTCQQYKATAIRVYLSSFFNGKNLLKYIDNLVKA